MALLRCTPQFYDPGLETAPREQLQEHQWGALRGLLKTVFEGNQFYRVKWAAAGVKDWRDIASLDEFRCLPLTTRQELSEDQAQYPPYGTNLSFPLDHYIKWYRTSGTKGKPLSILVTRRDWEAYAQTWADEYDAIGAKPGDSVYLPFSFGPFMGLWGAEVAAEAAGLLFMPGGGQTTLQRIQFILQYRPTVVVCLPSYALRMAEVAQENGIDLRQAGVRFLLNSGEPGPASVPALRPRLEDAWNAQSYDGYGMTEVGHAGHECLAQNGHHLLENAYFIEVLEPGGQRPVAAGEVGELVVTPLFRDGMPMIRYRTSDLVRLAVEPCACGRTLARLQGGILGRADGMIVVRGINIYPTAMDDILLSYPEVVEYRVEIYDKKGMKEIRVKIETGAEANGVVERLSQDLRRQLSLRAELEIVPPGSLPRWEGKAKRFVFHPVE